MDLYCVGVSCIGSIHPWGAEVSAVDIMLACTVLRQVHVAHADGLSVCAGRIKDKNWRI